MGRAGGVGPWVEVHETFSTLFANQINAKLLLGGI
jgi:hypothetical protein